MVPEVSCLHHWDEPPLAAKGVQPSLDRRPKQEVREHAVHDEKHRPLPDVSWPLGELACEANAHDHTLHDSEHDLKGEVRCVFLFSVGAVEGHLVVGNGGTTLECSVFCVCQSDRHRGHLLESGSTYNT